MMVVVPLKDVKAATHANLVAVANVVLSESLILAALRVLVISLPFVAAGPESCSLEGFSLSGSLSSSLVLFVFVDVVVANNTNLKTLRRRTNNSAILPVARQQREQRPL